MEQYDRYQDAVARLAACQYTVQAHESGYRVQHATDAIDSSFARNLDDLVDLADLMEWAAQRAAPPRVSPA